MTVTASRSIIASITSSARASGASAKVVRRLPSGVSGPKISRMARTESATFAHCLFSLFSRPSSSVRSVVRRSCSRRISISSSLRSERRRMLRIASA